MWGILLFCRRKCFLHNQMKQKCFAIFFVFDMFIKFNINRAHFIYGFNFRKRLPVAEPAFEQRRAHQHPLALGEVRGLAVRSPHPSRLLRAVCVRVARDNLVVFTLRPLAIDRSAEADVWIVRIRRSITTPLIQIF